jgi:hypothetical protein
VSLVDTGPSVIGPQNGRQREMSHADTRSAQPAGDQEQHYDRPQYLSWSKTRLRVLPGLSCTGSVLVEQSAETLLTLNLVDPGRKWDHVRCS